MVRLRSVKNQISDPNFSVPTEDVNSAYVKIQPTSLSFANCSRDNKTTVIPPQSPTNPREPRPQTIQRCQNSDNRHTPVTHFGPLHFSTCTSRSPEEEGLALRHRHPQRHRSIPATVVNPSNVRAATHDPRAQREEGGTGPGDEPVAVGTAACSSVTPRVVSGSGAYQSGARETRTTRPRVPAYVCA